RERIEHVGTPEDIAALAAQHGRFLVFSEDYEGAAPQLERALTLAESHDLPETLAQALNSKSVLMLYLHRPREARVLVKGALEVALAHDLHDAALRAYNNLIAMEWESEEGLQQLETQDRAIDYARRNGDRQWEISFLAGSVGPLFFVGRWDEALERAEAAEPYA